MAGIFRGQGSAIADCLNTRWDNFENIPWDSMVSASGVGHDKVLESAHLW